MIKNFINLLVIKLSVLILNNYLVNDRITNKVIAYFNSYNKSKK